jgi:hypothetical protein
LFVEYIVEARDSHTDGEMLDHSIKRPHPFHIT